MRGGGELAGGILSSFWWLDGCLEAFWEMEAMRLDIGGFEAGKWEAGGWKMWAQNKRTGGGPWFWLWFWRPGGRTYRRGGYQETADISQPVAPLLAGGGWRILIRVRVGTVLCCPWVRWDRDVGVIRLFFWFRQSVKGLAFEPNQF